MGLNYMGSSRNGEHGLIHDWCILWVLCHWTQTILINFQQFFTFKKIMYLTYGYSPFWVWDPYLFAIHFLFFHQSKFIFFSSKLENHWLNDGHVPSSTKHLAPLYEFCVSFTHPTIPWNLMHLSHIVLGLCKICYLRLKYHPSWRYWLFFHFIFSITFFSFPICPFQYKFWFFSSCFHSLLELCFILLQHFQQLLLWFCSLFSNQYNFFSLLWFVFLSFSMLCCNTFNDSSPLYFGDFLIILSMILLHFV
jgi:hypothetical protein